MPESAASVTPKQTIIGRPNDSLSKLKLRVRCGLIAGRAGAAQLYGLLAEQQTKA